MRYSVLIHHRILILPLLLLFATALSAEEGSVSPPSGPEAAGKLDSRCDPPKVTEVYEYYEITGSCENDLRRDMRRNANVLSKGEKYDANTDWELKWDYGYNRGRGICSVNSFTVNVNIVYRYPRWKAGEDAPPALVAKWGAYLRNLADHESLHSYQVVRAADELTRAVSLLPPAATCEDIDRAVQCLCDEKVKELREDQERYDRVSGHGAAQGAVFP